MATNHRAKIGTGPLSIIVFRYRYKIEPGAHVKFRRYDRPHDWKTGLVDRIDEDGVISISLF